MEDIEIKVKREDNYYVFYCEYCERTHKFSVRGHVKNVLPYRQSHCITPKSPYFRKNIYLRPW
jgi:hypothetical protein